jgi:2-dehydropantoate 2-reductase
MRLLVVGAGSTGAYFGGRLAAAGRDVSFLVRPRRAEQIRAHGLGVRSPHGDFTFEPKVLIAPELSGPFDAVLLTVKAFSLEQALRDITPAVGPETMILSVLNGMRHLDGIAQSFGSSAIVGCVCKVATMLDAKGHVVHLAPFNELAYGERDGTSSTRTTALDAFMQGAGFDARLSATIEREMWEKWTLLAAVGAMTCLMRGAIGDIVAAPGGLDYINATLAEVVAIVRAAGVAPSEPFLETIRRQLTAQGSTFASSMYRDLQQGAPIEADQIVGDLLARAAVSGVAAPLLATAYAHLRVYQDRLDHQASEAANG